MNIAEMNFAEIKQRKLEIKELVQTKSEEIDAEVLNNEWDELEERESKLNAIVEKREALEKRALETNEVVEEMKPEERKEETEKMEINKAEEYRSAWLKVAKGDKLNETEQRTYDNEINLGDAAAAIPEITQNAIIRKIKLLAPLLDEVTLLSVAGNVKFAVEGTVGDGALHTENAAITPATDSLVTVSLTGYEMVKLIRISAAVKTMSVGAFENWIVDQLSEAIARIIEYYMIKGDGTDEPKGVDALTYVDETNGVQWAANNKPTAAELIELVGYLKGGYHKNAKFLINHSTFWNHIYSLRDDSKFPIVQQDGEGWRLLGRPVLFSDYVTDDDIFFGDFKKVVANLGERVQIESQRNVQYNSFDYLGSALFDCDIALEEAFVKGAAAL